MLSDDMVRASSDSPFARQLRKGYSRLRFDEPAESQFLARYIENHLRKVRWASCTGMLLFILFAVLDAYLLPKPVAFWGTVIRVLVVLALIVTFLATFLPTLKKHLHTITITTCIIAGVGVILIIYIAQYYGADIPFTGMLLIVFVFYFLSGLLFRACMLTGFVALAVYVVLGLLFSSEAFDIIYNSGFLFAANLIGCVGCYSYEYAARTNFLVHALLNEMAERDGLTGLYNRRAFDLHLGHIWRQAIRMQTPVAIAMIDVDHFKQYNDYYGHQQGDEALKQIAAVLKEYAQRSGDLVARYGGEEFIGVWSDISLTETTTLLESIRERVEKQLALPQAEGVGHELVSVSIGLSFTVPRLAQDLTEQIKRADEALYRAKEKGRNQLVVDEEG